MRALANVEELKLTTVTRFLSYYCVSLLTVKCFVLGFYRIIINIC